MDSLFDPNLANDKDLSENPSTQPPWRNGRRFGLKIRNVENLKALLDKAFPNGFQNTPSAPRSKADVIRAKDRARKKIYRKHNKGKLRDYAAKYYKAHRAKLTRAVREWQANNKHRVRVLSRRYYRKYPERLAAHQAVHKALKSGVLVRQPCEVCGKPKVEAHHEDYSKTLEVIWLCSKHHAQADSRRRARERANDAHPHTHSSLVRAGGAR